MDRGTAWTFVVGARDSDLLPLFLSEAVVSGVMDIDGLGETDVAVVDNCECGTNPWEVDETTNDVSGVSCDGGSCIAWR